MNEKTLMKLVSVIIGIVGAWILMKSTLWGLNSASEYLQSVGGSMDATSFGMIQESFMVSYRLLGTLLLGLGGLSVIVSEKLFR